MNLDQLCELVKIGDTETIKAIITSHQNRDQFSWWRSSKEHVERALRKAILLGQAETVQLFLDAGVPADTSCKGKYFIHDAAQSGQISIVRLLLERGASIPKKCLTSVTKKLFNGKIDTKPLLKIHALEIVELLVQHGANIQKALASEYEIFSEACYKLSKKIEKTHTTPEQKQAFEMELQAQRHVWFHTLKTLLDYAFGVNFSINSFKAWLKGFDLSGLNFIGVSYADKPVSHAWLRKKISKKYATELALVTIQDLEKLPDDARKEGLARRLKQKMLEQGELISDNGIVNLLPLHCAVSSGDIAAVEARLNAGINPNQQYHGTKHSAIEFAIMYSHPRILLILAMHPLIDRIMIDKARQMAIMLESYYMITYLDAVTIDIDARNAYNGIIHKFTDNNCTSLHYAVLRNEPEIVQLLLSKGANPFLDNRKNELPIFMSASVSDQLEVEKKRYEILEMFQAHGVSFNTQNCNGDTLLTYIIRTMPRPAKACITTYKQDMSKSDVRRVKLAQKRFQHAVQLIRYLVSHGADINLANHDGRAPLHYLIASKLHSSPSEFEAVLDLLLQSGADINLPAKNGESPLDMAQDAFLINLLLSRGARRAIESDLPVLVNKPDSHVTDAPVTHRERFFQTSIQDAHDQERKNNTEQISLCKPLNEG